MAEKKTLEELQEGIDKAKQLRTKANSQKDIYEESLKKEDEKLKELGTTPEKAEDTLKELSKKAKTLKDEITNMIPFDLLEERESK